MDMGVHKYATINWILNDTVKSAYTWITKQCTNLKEKAEDNAMTFLEYKKGMIANITVSFTVVTPPTNSFEIYGTKGTILENHMWDKPVKINSTHEDMGDFKNIWYEPNIEHGSFPKYYEISARIEDNYFTECILTDTKPEFTPQQAREAVATVLLSYLSVKENKTVNYKDLLDIYNKEGTELIFKGLAEVIMNNCPESLDL